MNRACVALSVLAYALAAVAQRPDVEELRKENRLPEWANYVCYEDAKNLQSGWFMIVAYRSPADDSFFKDANAFGYKRGLTYQEYIGSDKDITAMNMPISPETYASELQANVQTKQVSIKAVELLTCPQFPRTGSYDVLDLLCF